MLVFPRAPVAQAVDLPGTNVCVRKGMVSGEQGVQIDARLIFFKICRTPVPSWRRQRPQVSTGSQIANAGAYMCARQGLERSCWAGELSWEMRWAWVRCMLSR